MSTHKTYHILIAILFPAVTAMFAQTWSSFTVEDGLANNRVYSIVVDESGNRWFGTYAGIACRYDGNDWENFVLNSQNIPAFGGHALAVDRDGSLWFGGSRGLARSSGGQWTTMDTSDGLPDNEVRAVVVDGDGVRWIATLNGVARFDGAGWTVYRAAQGLADNQVFCLAVDGNNHVWAGSLTGVSEFDGTAWRAFTPENGFDGQWVLSLAADRTGTVWAGCYRGGIGKYSGGAWSFFTATTPDSSDEIRSVRAIACDGDGKIWCGATREIRRTTQQGALETSMWNGVLCLDGAAWTTYDSAAGMAGNFVRAAAIDRANSVWIGTDRGVSTFYQTPVSLAPAAGVYSAVTVRTVAGRYGVIFTLKGVEYREIASIRIVGLDGKVVRTLVARDNNLFWNGANEQGRRVSKGVYFIEVKTGGVTVRHKFEW